MPNLCSTSLEQLQRFSFHLFTSFRSSRFLLLLALSLLLLPTTEAQVFGNFFRNLFRPVNDFFRPINNGFRNIFRFGSSSNAELRAAGDHFMLCFLTFLWWKMNVFDFVVLANKNQYSGSVSRKGKAVPGRLRTKLKKKLN